MKKLTLEEYKHYVSVNPELAAILRKEENTLVLISDMEYLFLRYEQKMMH